MEALMTQTLHRLIIRPGSARGGPWQRVPK
jgi:hypothetical protein